MSPKKISAPSPVKVKHRKSAAKDNHDDDDDAVISADEALKLAGDRLGEFATTQLGVNATTGA